ncbi:glycoside hydrolase family 92 protein [Fistulina hepatica ATCC 64428]|uniref:Glycoside hydrolase family 92 protein n=1 Tax=Fistulina hepatica ATCC 64428 TaxID=1128425 RepID=A0A0D7ALN0_9AGAR|nr:glycoside hydrolase family 92 protein [Fistulina hepatica ATCC 64428]
MGSSVLVGLFFASTALAGILPKEFAVPSSKQVDYVNPLIGNGGDTPNGSGGMIPSTAPPFAMTRWVAQTHENYVSVTPYNLSAERVHGFQATHQPAIWMGESGPVVVVPGNGISVEPQFAKRGMPFVNRAEREIISPSYYSVDLGLSEGGVLHAEQSATSRVGHLRFTFNDVTNPYVLIEASRPSVITSTPTNITYPRGYVAVDAVRRQITGYNSEQQDWIIHPTSIAAAASGFRGYFCARFDKPFAVVGVYKNYTLLPADIEEAEGSLVSAFAPFDVPEGQRSLQVDVRVGVSFISMAQACRNLDREIPDATSLEETARQTRTQWAEKLDRITIEAAASDNDLSTFYTAVYHSLQYPYEQHEWDGRPVYYSGYDDAVHEGESYSGYSIWDTYRAEWAWLILFAPERIPSMITSMLQDYLEGGWLPMWKNIIATHSDSLIAEAAIKNVGMFDQELAWTALFKDGTHPPKDDHHNVDYEVRAGLSSVYAQKGWVADDVHSESASRTLDYAYDDFAISVFAEHLKKPDNLTSFFRDRSMSSSYVLWNEATGFMEARNADGSFAGPDRGWTEGDKWVYSFDVVHDVQGLIERRGGKGGFVASLDEFWDGGHGDFGNEPAHHVPYLYTFAGPEFAYKSQERIRVTAQENYNNTPEGLSGNEDCGQMSAWYIFSALGFYPVNPVSGEYILGSPFFDKISIDLPTPPWHTPTDPDVAPLTVYAKGAPSKPYVRSVMADRPLVMDLPQGDFAIKHSWISHGADIYFEMSSSPDARVASSRDDSEL